MLHEKFNNDVMIGVGCFFAAGECEDLAKLGENFVSKLDDAFENPGSILDDAKFLIERAVLDVKVARSNQPKSVEINYSQTKLGKNIISRLTNAETSMDFDQALTFLGNGVRNLNCAKNSESSLELLNANTYDLVETLTDIYSVHAWHLREIGRSVMPSYSYDRELAKAA